MFSISFTLIRFVFSCHLTLELNKKTQLNELNVHNKYINEVLFMLE